MLAVLNFKKIVFFVLVAICLFPFVNAPIALVMGIVMANTLANPFEASSANTVKWLLKFAVVGLGFGMNFYSAVQAGKDGLIFTMATIALVLTLGWILGKILNVDPKTSFLVSSGTAICGGSAIAAVAPIIDADSKQISVALGTVFILNAAALLFFPIVGHYFELSQFQFGLWSAIAIHDTSSVVGAASEYGADALETATTIKLGRALWIIPLSILTVYLNKKNKNKINIPYFIGLFILAMVVNTMFPQYEPVYTWIVLVAKKALVVTLFLIGSGLSIRIIRSVGAKTFLQGLLLWIVISIVSLAVIISIY